MIKLEHGLPFYLVGRHIVSSAPTGKIQVFDTTPGEQGIRCESRRTVGLIEAALRGIEPANCEANLTIEVNHRAVSISGTIRAWDSEAVRIAKAAIADIDALTADYAIRFFRGSFSITYRLARTTDVVAEGSTKAA